MPSACRQRRLRREAPRCPGFPPRSRSPPSPSFALAAFALALVVGSVRARPDDRAARACRQRRRRRRARSCASCACRARSRRSRPAASLALAGALLQVLLRNPLADPYVLGVSGGAAVGALAAMLLGRASRWLIPAGAFAGAIRLDRDRLRTRRAAPAPGRRRGCCSPASSSRPAGARSLRCSCRSRPRRSCAACCSG